MLSSETGGSAGLVDEDEFRGIKIELEGEPVPALLQNVRAPLLPFDDVFDPRSVLPSTRDSLARGRAHQVKDQEHQKGTGGNLDESVRHLFSSRFDPRRRAALCAAQDTSAISD